MQVNAVPNSGSVISCTSSGQTGKLADHFEGLQVTLPSEREYSVEVANELQVPIGERTGKVQVTLATPWAPEVSTLALAIIPERDNVVNIGNKNLREPLGIDVMAGLEGTALCALGQNADV